MRLLLALLVLLVLPASAAAAPVLGVYSEERPEQAAAPIAQTGFAAVRRPWDWALMEPRKGDFDWEGYDVLVAEYARAGLTILPFLVDAPPWAVDRAGGDGSETGLRPPRDPDDLARFAARCVKRWGPGGTFWRANRGLPYHPIRAWQVWNEPNIPAFWRPEPNAAAYVKLLFAASLRIHAADPEATVVAAGLPDSQGGIPQADFLRQAYAAGLKGDADAIAVHAYAADAVGALALVAEARRLMTANGDGAPLWVTEFGWANAGEPSLFTVDARLQARLVGDALRGLRALAGPLNLGGIFLFRWQDPTERTLSLDIWPYHSGLLKARGAAKPVMAQVRAALSAAVPASTGPVTPAPFTTRLVTIGARAVRIRCSRPCAAGVVLVERIPRPGRATQQLVRARRSVTLGGGSGGRRVRLPRLAGRAVTFSAITADGAARRVSRSYHRTSRR